MFCLRLHVWEDSRSLYVVTGSVTDKFQTSARPRQKRGEAEVFPHAIQGRNPILVSSVKTQIFEVLSLNIYTICCMKLKDPQIFQTFPKTLIFLRALPLAGGPKQLSEPSHNRFLRL